MNNWNDNDFLISSREKRARSPNSLTSRPSNSEIYSSMVSYRACNHWFLLRRWLIWHCLSARFDYCTDDLPSTTTPVRSRMHCSRDSMKITDDSMIGWRTSYFICTSTTHACMSTTVHYPILAALAKRTWLATWARIVMARPISESWSLIITVSTFICTIGV